MARGTSKDPPAVPDDLKVEAKSGALFREFLVPTYVKPPPLVQRLGPHAEGEVARSPGPVRRQHVAPERGVRVDGQ
jgi:hypothetical protein